MTPSDLDTSSNQPCKWRQVRALLCIYILQFCYGMNSGFPAVMVPQLKEHCFTEVTITDLDASLIMSLDNVATPFVCILNGFLQQKFGPKKMLLVSCFPYLVAWLLTGFAPKSLDWIFVSRAVVGVSHAMVTTTVYTVEVASKDLRGTLSLWEGAVRCLGCLCVYTMGAFMRWTTIAKCGIVTPILAMVVGLGIPESPVFLLSKGQQELAENSMKRLYGDKFDTSDRLESINISIQVQKGRLQRNRHLLKKIGKHPEVYKPFLIMVLLVILQQLSGTSIMRSYVILIFEDIFGSTTAPANDTNTLHLSEPCHVTSKAAYVSAMVLSAVRLTSTLSLSYIMLRLGRRPLYFLSLVATCISLSLFATITLVLDLKDHHTNLLPILALISACFQVFFAQLGLQTLPNILSGVLFSSDVRAVMKGVTRSLTCVLIVLCLMTFPLLCEAIGIYGTFYSFSGALLLFFPLVWHFLPETKDMELESIQHLFIKTPA